MAYTLITSNNATFTANVQWNFTTSAATRSNVYLQAKNNTALIFQATVTNPTTGTFNILNIKGRRTDSSSSYQNVNSAWINVKFDNASSWTTNNKCNIYFNTKSTSWSSAPNWTKAGSTFTFQQTNVAVGTGKYLNIKTQGTQATINKQFNTTVNCGVSTTRTYSKDNATWQSSATITGLTPNTSYTIYMKTLTNAGGVNGIHTTYDSKTMKTPCNAPTNLKLCLTDDSCLYGYVLKASADGDTNAPITNITVYAREAGTIPFTHSAIADSNGQVVFMPSEPWQGIECLIEATNAGGTTYAMSIPWEYQQYQYITAQGTQCIDTGYQFGCNSAIHCRFQFSGTPATQSRIFGIREGNNDGTGGFSTGIYVNAGMGMSWYAQDGTGTFNATSAYWDSLEHDYIIDSFYNSGTGRYAIGNIVGATMPAATVRRNEHATRNLMLAGENYFDTPTNFATGKLYTTCILENDMPVALFVPAVRKSDSVTGMYDPVRKQFYASYTSTAFPTPPANTKETTVSTSFWVDNPAVWVKTSDGWKKRKYLYYKESASSWERAGAYNPEVGIGIKTKYRPTSTATIRWVPLEYLQSDGYTNYFTLGMTTYSWWGCKIKASITDRYATSGPHLVSDANKQYLWIVPRADRLLVDYCGSQNWDNWTPTLNQPFTITFRSDKGQMLIEDGSNVHSILFNGGKLAPEASTIYLLNYGGDYTSGTYGFKGKIYYIITYINGRINRYLIPIKITYSTSSSYSVGDVLFYDLKGKAYYKVNGDGGVTGGPEITNDTGNWWPACDF